MKEMSDSRTKMFEQMEAAVNSLEETNARLVEEAMVDKNRIRMQDELLIVKGFRVLILGC